jgi:hypothetical protein
VKKSVEYASRSGESPVLTLGLLHQSFEEYGRHLDLLSRTEWSKIQGRFQDVAFLEPPEQVLRMVAAAIKWKSADIPASLKRQAKHLAEKAAAVGVCPHGMKTNEFVNVCVRAYARGEGELVPTFNSRMLSSITCQPDQWLPDATVLRQAPFGTSRCATSMTPPKCHVCLPSTLGLAV